MLLACKRGRRAEEGTGHAQKKRDHPQVDANVSKGTTGGGEGAKCKR